MTRVSSRAGIRRLALATLTAALSLSAGAAPPGPAGAAGAATPGRPEFRTDLPDPPRPGALPEDYVILRVGDREVTARRFSESYHDALGPDRPPSDSAGRVAFLEVLATKELLAAEARRLDPPLSFEERMQLREQASRIHSNVLYRRLVLDPIVVTDQEVLDAYQLLDAEVRLRSILLPSREAAERLRRDLLATRIGWSSAVQRHSIGLREDDGDLGWQQGLQITMGFALVTHRLKVGEISPPVRARDGWILYQCTARRAAPRPALEPIRELIRQQIATHRSNLLADAFQDTLAAEIELVVDSATVRWAAAQFPAATSTSVGSGIPEVTINAALPEFAPADTGRVLARFRGGQLTVGGFLYDYGNLPPVLRPSVNEYGALRAQVIATAISPRTAVVAVERGMDRDPAALVEIARRKEALQVERLYADSVEANIRIPSGAHRRFYEENRHRFHSERSVTYAALVRPSQAGIDSVRRRIEAGVPPGAILREDSLAGRPSGSIQVRHEHDRGTPHYSVLFDDLRRGQTWTTGPDRAGDHLLIHVLDRDDGHPQPYEEVATLIDEALQAREAERLLHEWVGRLARRYPVSWRPDLVMRADFRFR